eukprot:365653-Chlamydomonas_euryale.AAC.4
MLAEVERADALIYGMGSLYTSLCPIVCLDGVGELIAGRGTGVPKLLCLNGSHDRETASSGTRDGPMTASDIVQVRSRERFAACLRRRPPGRPSVATRPRWTATAGSEARVR